MKRQLRCLIVTLCLVGLTSTTSYAGCGGGCGGGISSFFATIDPAPVGCGSRSPDLNCDCTDPGMYYNDCISRSTYCEAFGNVGAR